MPQGRGLRGVTNPPCASGCVAASLASLYPRDASGILPVPSPYLGQPKCARRANSPWGGNHCSCWEGTVTPGPPSLPPLCCGLAVCARTDGTLHTVSLGAAPAPRTAGPHGVALSSLPGPETSGPGQPPQDSLSREGRQFPSFAFPQSRTLSPLRLTRFYSPSWAQRREPTPRGAWTFQRRSRAPGTVRGCQAGPRCRREGQGSREQGPRSSLTGRQPVAWTDVLRVLVKCGPRDSSQPEGRGLWT